MSARKINRLTARQVEHAPAGKHADGGGLTLAVSKSGAKSWVVRLTVDGRQRDIGIGSASTVTLADARQRAREMRAELADGGDPRSARRDTAPTFAECAREVHRQKLPTFRSERAASEWFARLRRHALPTLGEMPVDRIDRGDVLAVLDPIWIEKNHTARKVREGVAQVMRFAMGRGWRDTNPAGEMIDGALLRQPTGGNLPAVGWPDVPAVMALIGDHDGSDTVRLLMAFQILTATRPAEARGAMWSEIDIEAATWTVPADRMKSGRAHVVPLSTAALAVVEHARSFATVVGSAYVFPSPRSLRQPMAHSTALDRLKRWNVRTATGDVATMHGFRSAFRTWAEEATATPWAVSEAALAHRVGDDVATRYLRSDLFDKRRALMQAWADFATMPAGAKAPDTAEHIAS